MGEVFIKINGRFHHVRRVVNQDGSGLDSPAENKRDAKAAIRFPRRRLRHLP
ncbi:DDE-type integrase/transposase/recombinase [Streptomyces sp. NPDC097981]|uniref:DDE-type integrase/transposase/recombinase n=1 Tax=Streptomyces sp. NPDC097981 TaxID=3155428 RepID=UPI003331B1DA